MTHWIQLLNGGQYEYGPHTFKHEARIVGPFSIEDVAVPLSHIARYLGHTRTPWSVAAHAVLVARLCDGLDALTCLAALHHDDHECIVGDMPAPLKWHLDDPVGSAAEYAQRAIRERLGLQAPTSEQEDIVKRADLAALEGERRALMVPCTRAWSTPFDPVLADRAEAYVHRFASLGFSEAAASMFDSEHRVLMSKLP